MNAIESGLKLQEDDVLSVMASFAVLNNYQLE